VDLLLLTAGSRGDVEPFVALAQAAVAAGHRVHLGIPDGSGVDVDGSVPLVPLHVDFSRLVADQGVSPWAAARSMRTTIRPAMGRMLSAAARAIVHVRPDVVVHHPKVLSAPAAATCVGATSVVAEIVPTLTPTRAFPMPGTVGVSLGPFNRATYRAGSAAAAMFRREVDAALAPHGISGDARRARPAGSLVPISPLLQARPADWPATTQLTGPWVSRTPSAPLDADVARFVAQGAFVYAGFGSMASGDPRARAAAIVEAARARGLAVLLATGWGGLELPDDARGADVLCVRSVPHDQVLPHAVVAVHHGGAGTSHAAVRAGVPSVVVPFIADQPFWAHRLAERGLGAPPVPRRRVSARRIGGAIDAARALRTDTLASAASTMREEDGTARALDALEVLRR